MTKLIVDKKVKNCVRYVSDASKAINMRVDNVRASYPHVGEKWAQKADETPAYSIVGLLNKETHKEAHDLINEAIEEMIAKQNSLKGGFRCPASKRALKDGDNEEFSKPETEGHWILSTREPKNLPTLKARKNGQVVNITPQEAEQMFYGGCYCSILFRIWPQDNDYGKRVNGGLQGVVFLKDGEAFGEDRIDDSDAYEDLDDSDGGFDEDDDL